MDPQEAKMPGWSSFRAFFDNPVKVIDPTGQFESTDVEKNEDGTYHVVGGNQNDGDNGIYVRNEDGSRGQLIGFSATPESFYNSGMGQWQGTICPTDMSGINFLEKEIFSEPNILNYMYNATGGRRLDFKTNNGTGGKIFSTDEEYYRGMPLYEESWGRPKIYASARDIGNIAAGFVAGREGMDWPIARLGFDGLESLQQSKLASESTSTQYGQKLGWIMGRRMFEKIDLSRLPSYGEMKGTTPYKGIIGKNDL